MNTREHAEGAGVHSPKKKSKHVGPGKKVVSIYLDSDLHKRMRAKVAIRTGLTAPQNFLRGIKSGLSARCQLEQTFKAEFANTKTKKG